MVENNPHIETTKDNYELLYDLETWLLDILHHALARINVRFIQVYTRVANFHDSSMILFFFVKLLEANICTMYCEVERGFPLHTAYFSLK